MVLGLDLGGTKLAVALLSESGTIVSKDHFSLGMRTGKEVGKLIADAVVNYLRISEAPVRAIGVSVPGIARTGSGTVWAPNIPGWDDYPLVENIRTVAGQIPVNIDSDRACCMLGELWQGNARGCRDAIYLAVGTGIGAGILIDGKILRGSHDIGGSVGWMALDKPFDRKYVPCGCFEYYASGDGIARFTRELLDKEPLYAGVLRDHAQLSAYHVFEAFDSGDPIAVRVLNECIIYWGMAAANLVSLLNPEKIIFGGGIFGPALRFLKSIEEESRKWAQPISITQVKFEASGLHGDAPIYGAGFLALNNIKD